MEATADRGTARAAISVLVVDDDLAIRRMLERVLAGAGFTVESAGGGGDALVRVERSVPDLLVLDVAMPAVDGLAVTRRLRAKGLALPILLLTARDAVRERVDGLEAGADDYLVKPFDTDELVARLRALLRRNRPPDRDARVRRHLARPAVRRRVARRPAAAADPPGGAAAGAPDAPRPRHRRA